MDQKRARQISSKIVILILGAAMLSSAFFSVRTIRNLQGNARVINYTGVVRGGTQRLVKQELQRNPDDPLIDRLDSILTELATGQGEDGLISLDSAEYQELLDRMQAEWRELKEAISDFRAGGSSEALYALSEAFFDLADQTVSAAERYTEQAVQSAKIALVLVSFACVILAAVCSLTAHIQRRRGALLEAREAEAQERRARLERMYQDIRAPLNQLSELIYVSDLETHELMFVNNAGNETFHLDHLTGMKCYEALQGLDAPCSFCSTPKLKPGENYEWEYTNPLTKRHYLLKDRLIEWNGRPARIEIAFDMTEAQREKQELKNMLDSEKVLVECIRELYQNHDLRQAMAFVLGQVGKFLCADRAYLFEIRESGEAVNTHEWCAEGIEAEKEHLKSVPMEAFSRWIEAFEHDEFLAIDEVEDLREALPEEYAILTGQHIQRLVTVPLERDGRLTAFIGVDNPWWSMQKNAISLLQALRYFIMLAVRRSEDEDAMNKLSYFDTLTSFYNRNRYMQDLQRFAREETPFGIVYLDLNGLKDVNDQQGHAAGDRLLVECAQYIQESFPRSNLYRIGGDEFVVIFTGGDQAQFLESVEDLSLRFRRSERCRAAIGAHWAREGTQIESAVAAADQKMYADKQAFYRGGPDSKRYRHNVDGDRPEA